MFDSTRTHLRSLWTGIILLALLLPSFLAWPQRAHATEPLEVSGKIAQQGPASVLDLIVMVDVSYHMDYERSDGDPTKSNDPAGQRFDALQKLFSYLVWAQHNQLGKYDEIRLAVIYYGAESRSFFSENGHSSDWLELITVPPTGTNQWQHGMSNTSCRDSDGICRGLRKDAAVSYTKAIQLAAILFNEQPLTHQVNHHRALIFLGRGVPCVTNCCIPANCGRDNKSIAEMDTFKNYVLQNDGPGGAFENTDIYAPLLDNLSSDAARPYPSQWQEVVSHRNPQIVSYANRAFWIASAGSFSATLMDITAEILAQIPPQATPYKQLVISSSTSSDSIEVPPFVQRLTFTTNYPLARGAEYDKLRVSPPGESACLTSTNVWEIDEYLKVSCTGENITGENIEVAYWPDNNSPLIQQWTIFNPRPGRWTVGKNFDSRSEYRQQDSIQARYDYTNLTLAPLAISPTGSYFQYQRIDLGIQMTRNYPLDRDGITLGVEGFAITGGFLQTSSSDLIKVTSFDPPVSGSPGLLTGVVYALEQGSYTLQLKATDQAGNPVGLPPGQSTQAPIVVTSAGLNITITPPGGTIGSGNYVKMNATLNNVIPQSNTVFDLVFNYEITYLPDDSRVHADMLVQDANTLTSWSGIYHINNSLPMHQYAVKIRWQIKNPEKNFQYDSTALTSQIYTFDPSNASSAPAQ
ncbi:MAG: hypothetical protein GX573_08880 [Chloroflexi bacterium]|nr:hypothetical protein [Chloroflexota bacterium]